MTLLLAARKLDCEADDNGVGAAVQSPALNAGTVIGLASLWVI